MLIFVVDLQDLQDLEDHQVDRETEVCKDHRVNEDNLDPLDNPALTVNLERVDQMVHQGSKVLQDAEASLDPRVNQDLKVLVANEVSLEEQDSEVFQAVKELLDPKDQQVQEDHEVHLEKLEPEEHREKEVNPEEQLNAENGVH